MNDSNLISQLRQRMVLLASAPIPRHATYVEIQEAVTSFGQLIKRYALATSRASLRREICIAIELGFPDKRPPPIAGCVSSLARFCDCQIWLGQDNGRFKFNFFGFEAHVQIATHLLALFQSALDRQDLQADTITGTEPARKRRILGDRRAAVRDINQLLESTSQARNAQIALERSSPSDIETNIRAAVDSALLSIRSGPHQTAASVHRHGNADVTTRNGAGVLEATGQRTRNLATLAPASHNTTAQTGVSVTGKVEGVVGTWILGWAVDPNKRSPCVIFVVDETGIVVSTTLANQPRADLSALNFIRSDFSFRASVKTLGASRLLRVFADGIELDGSPVEAGGGIFDGVASTFGDCVHGWVSERRFRFDAPVITLVDQDDRVIGRAQSIIDELDGSPRARFTVNFTPDAYGRRNLAVLVAANGVRFCSVTTSLPLNGCLDSLEDGRCRGWLLSPSMPRLPLQLEVWVDGTSAGVGPINVRRDDVLNEHPDHLYCGFDLKLKPFSVSNRKDHRISVRFRNGERELFGGPFIEQAIESRVEAVKEIGSLVHSMADLKASQRSVLHEALLQHLGHLRSDGKIPSIYRLRGISAPPTDRRLNVLVAVSGDPEQLRICLDSLLVCRHVDTDAIGLLISKIADSDCREVAYSYRHHRNIYLLHGLDNGKAPRIDSDALDFFHAGDVVVLDAATRLFPGVLDELHSAAHSSADIGTASALSNSSAELCYPGDGFANEMLREMTWGQLSAAALRTNHGRVIKTASVNETCLLIRRSALNAIGISALALPNPDLNLREICAAADDLGLRNVVACAAFVENLQSEDRDRSVIRFRQEVRKAAAKRITAPDVSLTIQANFMIRSARWPLDTFFLRRKAKMGLKFQLVITNTLSADLATAIADARPSNEDDKLSTIVVVADTDDMVYFTCNDPHIFAAFHSNEDRHLFAMFERLDIRVIQVHHLLRFTAKFVRRLLEWKGPKRLAFYLNDYYPICPRVNLIDAAEAFCGVPPESVCSRCVEKGGTDYNSRMDDLAPHQHRDLFAQLFSIADRIIAPSASAASYLTKVFANLKPPVILTDEQVAASPPEETDLSTCQSGSVDCTNIVLLGKINAQEGSHILAELAEAARIYFPELRFSIVGDTDVNERLLRSSNTTITGPNGLDEQAEILGRLRGRMALFLHRWPKPRCQELTDAIRFGLIPVVPDIGELVARVRQIGYGYVFPLQSNVRSILEVLESAIREQQASKRPGSGLSRPTKLLVPGTPPSSAGDHSQVC